MGCDEAAGRMIRRSRADVRPGSAAARGANPSAASLLARANVGIAEGEASRSPMTPRQRNVFGGTATADVANVRHLAVTFTHFRPTGTRYRSGSPTWRTAGGVPSVGPPGGSPAA